MKTKESSMGADAGVALAMFVRVEQTVQHRFGLVSFKFLDFFVLQCPPSS